MKKLRLQTRALIAFRQHKSQSNADCGGTQCRHEVAIEDTKQANGCRGFCEITSNRSSEPKVMETNGIDEIMMRLIPLCCILMPQNSRHFFPRNCSIQSQSWTNIETPHARIGECVEHCLLCFKPRRRCCAAYSVSYVATNQLNSREMPMSAILINIHLVNGRT